MDLTTSSEPGGSSLRGPLNPTARRSFTFQLDRLDTDERPSHTPTAPRYIRLKIGERRYAFHHWLILGKNHQANHDVTHRPTRPRHEHCRGFRHAEIDRRALEQLEDHLLGCDRHARRQGFATRLLR